MTGISCHLFCMPLLCYYTFDPQGDELCGKKDGEQTAV